MWPRAWNMIPKCSVGGYARGGMRGPFGKIASSPSSGTSFFSDPQRCARFPGSGNESSDLVFRNLIFRVPQRRVRFRSFLLSPFAARSRANGPSKPLKTHFWVCAGYARPKGMAYPAKRFPPSGLEKHACAKWVCARVCALYIYTLVHISARVCARVCASYIYVFSRKLTPKWLGMREGMCTIYIYRFLHTV